LRVKDLTKSINSCIVIPPDQVTTKEIPKRELRVFHPVYFSPLLSEDTQSVTTKEIPKRELRV
jgi:hypothetical protein